MCVCNKCTNTVETPCTGERSEQVENKTFPPLRVSLSLSWKYQRYQWEGGTNTSSSSNSRYTCESGERGNRPGTNLYEREREREWLRDFLPIFLFFFPHTCSSSVVHCRAQRERERDKILTPPSFYLQLYSYLFFVVPVHCNIFFTCVCVSYSITLCCCSLLSFFPSFSPLIVLNRVPFKRSTTF